MTSTISNFFELITENNKSILKHTPSKQNNRFESTPSPFSTSTNQKSIPKKSNSSNKNFPFKTSITGLTKVNSVKIPKNSFNKIQHKHTMVYIHLMYL